MATRALMSGVRHIRGCPRPAPAPPPPPAPPALPSLPMGVLTDTGTARNGPALYPGLYVNSQGVAGAITVRNGPDANYPVVQHIPTPTTGAWHYADGVNPADESTWPRVQSLWAIFAGTTQNVSFYCKDFTDSPFADSTVEEEVARVAAPYTGSTYYWKAKGSGGAGDGSAGSPFNGARALSDALSSIPDWSIIEFVYTNGPVTIATDGADWPTTRTVSDRFPSGSATQSGTTNPGGVIFGSSMIGTSTASKLYFKFDRTQLSFNMEGASATAQRMWAAVRWMGEQVTVTGLWVRPPDWFYLCDPTTGATRISGPFSNAEDASYENHGCILFGNGNHLVNFKIEGNKKASVYGLIYAAAEDGVSNASAGLRGTIAFGEISGTLTGMQARAFGATGYDLEIPTGLDIHHITCSNPGWGHAPAFLDLSSAGSGNAAGHGNGIAIQGKWFGNCLVYRNTVTGGYQDAFAGTGAGVVCSDNYAYTISRTTNRSEWYWNTTPTPDVWAVRTVSNTEGNGFKTGLVNKDYDGPDEWLGTNGEPMTDAIKGDTDHLGVAEVRWILLRNIIHDVNGVGITSNESSGVFAHANEIVDPQGAGISLIAVSTQNGTCVRNWYLSHNIIKKTVTGSYANASASCLRIEGISDNGKRIWMHNNILWAGASQTEIFVQSGGFISFEENTKNVLVRGAISGTYSQTNNLTDAGSKTAAQAYVFSVNGVKTSAGLPSGNSLRTAGATTPQTGARTHGCYLDFRGEALHATTPCVGPCNAP